MKHEIPAHATFRPGTVDEDIWREAVEHNVYRLPAIFDHGDWVLDLGAHTGAVSWRCANSGARVVAVEASRENYHLLTHNLRPVWDRVMIAHVAVWRSDKGVSVVPFQPNWVPANTGGGCTMGDTGTTGYEVLAVPLDDLLRLCQRWRLLKLDIEGAEFTCLFTSKELHRVTEITAEYHRRADCLPFADTGKPCEIAELKESLEKEKFAVEVHEKAPGVGLFFATRR